MTTQPAYARHFWAKSDRENPERIHLLEHHLADVGACLERLLKQPTIRQRLASAGGMDTLDDATAARLAVFAALHDIGKVNIGFQTRIWKDADLPAGRRRPHRAGHTGDLTPVLSWKDCRTAEWFLPNLGFDRIEFWDNNGGETACGLFVAALSHHGQPLQLDNLHKSEMPGSWQPYGDLHPQEYTARIGNLLLQWFPDAIVPDAPPLPSAPAFQHHFLGLCNLADWIGSNEEWFKFKDTPDDDYIIRARRQAKCAIRKVGLDVKAQRKVFGSADAVPDFGKLFTFGASDANAEPKAIQQAAAQDTPLEAPVAIIESETGSGKTEAALWRFARMYAKGLVDGMYFALPTRAAAVQIHSRVEQFVARLFPAGQRPPVVLAVPGYRDDNPASVAIEIPDYPRGHDTHADDEKPWATESPKRFLAAQIAVGTVDQAMLGVLKVKNAHLRSSGLARNLLVVDEVHASDVYMGVILQRLLAAHAGAGGYALLMSATLGSAARERWLRAAANGMPANDAADGDSLPDITAAIAAPYPAVSTAAGGVREAGANGQDKTVHISAMPGMGDFDAAARRALDAARAGAKVLVVRNTVRYAVNTQGKIEDLAGAGAADAGLCFAVKGIPTLHHGRFAAGDRRLLDQQVQALLGKDTRASGGVIVVGTQTLEQSLDIDADLLITDLCPVDVLLQRIGRLHRHRPNDRPAAYRTPQCIVLTPTDNDLAPLLKRSSNANGLGEYGGVYVDLRILEATRRLIGEYPQWRIPEQNRELVERATHPAALDAIAQQMGEGWPAHAISVKGQQIADFMAGGRAVIPFNRSFFADNDQVVFPPGDEEKIRTRLGDERVEIAFDPAPASPFDGKPINKVAMRLNWLRRRDGDSVNIPQEPIETESVAGGFEFDIGGQRFHYDRRGLRRL